MPTSQDKQKRFWLCLPNMVANWHSNTANSLFTAKPTNEGELGAFVKI